MRHITPVLVAILAVLALSGISEARWYDPESGRFLSEDPIGFEGGDTNLYVYTKNNPVNLTDPTGLNPLLGAAGACLIDPPCAGAVMIFLAGAWQTICKNPPPPPKNKSDYDDECDNKFSECLLNGWRFVAIKGGNIRKERIECGKCYVRCKTEGGWPMDLSCGF